ncbi:unnamed protein product [Calypogeia fissa]
METNFREHDVEFLQKQAKIWLESVLGEKYGDRNFGELISNGNILYRVSKHIIREMTGASPGPPEMSPRSFSQLSEVGKNSGKYLPYANVDSFLKACKKIGMSDIELFTPPDAVEGKDLRRVCTSLRTLARKARAQHIRVPDFEDVNRPLPMPKQKIEGIKDTLRHSHSSPTTPTVRTPEADIVKSERVQIIRRFLSATTNPLYGPEGDGASRSPSEPPSPVTPGPFSTKGSPLSTPPPTISGIDTPALMKSVSAIEPTPEHVKSAKSSFASSPHAISSHEPKQDEAVMTPSSPSPDSSVDGPNDLLPTFSQKALGSFRHANPHFIKNPPPQSNTTGLVYDHLVEDPDPEAEEETPSSHHEAEEEAPSSHPEGEEETPSAPPDSAPTSAAISSDHSADKQRPKEVPTLAHLGLGNAYRHASPHFSFKKSSEADSKDFQDLQTEFPEAKVEDDDTPKASNVKPKAPSSNKMVERHPRSNVQETDVPPTAPSTAPAKVPAKDPASKPEKKAPGRVLSARLWMPLVAGALAFVGTLLVVRSRYNSTQREPVLYEVKEGDTLSTISKKLGKKSWDELVRLNPSIANPDLIYPTERLKLAP